MSISELKEELQKDLKIEMDDIHKDSNENPLLHGKWLGYALDEQIKLASLQSKLKQLKLKKRNYYLGRGDPQEYKEKPFNLNILKGEVDRFVDADPDIRELEDRINARMILIDFLEGAVKAISSKQWAIKNTIAFLHFKNGMGG